MLLSEEKKFSSEEKDKMIESSPALSLPFDRVIPNSPPSDQQGGEDDNLPTDTQLGWRGREGRQREEEENEHPSLVPPSSSSTSGMMTRETQEGISSYLLVWELGAEDEEESSGRLPPPQRGNGRRPLDSHTTTLGRIGGEGDAGSLNGSLLMMKVRRKNTFIHSSLSLLLPREQRRNLS